LLSNKWNKDIDSAINYKEAIIVFYHKQLITQNVGCVRIQITQAIEKICLRKWNEIGSKFGLTIFYSLLKCRRDDNVQWLVL
jgi:hypothetical protein